MGNIGEAKVVVFCGHDATMCVVWLEQWRRHHGTCRPELAGGL
jgi:hypothetical protein